MILMPIVSKSLHQVFVDKVMRSVDAMPWMILLLKY